MKLSKKEVSPSIGITNFVTVYSEESHRCRFSSYIPASASIFNINRGPIAFNQWGTKVSSKLIQLCYSCYSCWCYPGFWQTLITVDRSEKFVNWRPLLQFDNSSTRIEEKLEAKAVLFSVFKNLLEFEFEFIFVIRNQ